MTVSNQEHLIICNIWHDNLTEADHVSHASVLACVRMN